MTEKKKIMAALEFTDYSKGIFEYAAGIAKDINADLIVVSVINARDVKAVCMVASMGYAVQAEDYTNGVKEEREAALKKIIEESSFSAKKFKSIFAVGNPADELLRIAVKEGVDMIVMGTKGRTNLEYALLGSVAEKVFRRSPVPILSYRDKKIAKRLEKRIMK